MSKDNLDAELVALSLENIQLTGRISFRWGQFSIHGSDYSAVARAIPGEGPEGAISVSRSGGSKARRRTRATYSPSRNLLWFNTDIWEAPSPSMPRGNGLKERSTFVHEATHCIQDLKNWKMTVGQAETMAHIAQAFPFGQDQQGTAVQ
jgi:hypothetical protein